MTPARYEPLIPRRDLAASVLCEAIADALTDMAVAGWVGTLTPKQIDAIAAGIARSLAPSHMLTSRQGDREVHRLTVNAEVAR